MNQGIDVVLMLDTSSSMNDEVTTTDSNGNTVTKTRIGVLRDSVGNLITSFNQPNEAGIVQDIDIAIADFNGYVISGKRCLTATTTSPTRPSGPTATTLRSTPARAQ